MPQYAVIRTNKSRPAEIFAHFNNGTLRQGWGYHPRQDLRLIQAKRARGETLDKHERDAWGNFEPVGDTRSHAYTGKPNQGEHGGGTLAEVLAPAILLGTADLFDQTLGAERATELVPLRAPSWWFDEVREGEGRKAAVAAETRRRLAKLEKADDKRPAEAPDTQLSLAVVQPLPSPFQGQDQADLQALAEAEAEARVTEVEAKSRARGKKWAGSITETTRELLDKLERNPLFTARAPKPALQQEVLAALEYLLERQDRASGAAFARHMNKSERRVSQLVSNLETVLNVDGYDVLSYEHRTKRVELNRELLIQSFGL